MSHKKRQDPTKASPQGEVMSRILLKNGFVQADFRRLTMGTCTLYIAEK